MIYLALFYQFFVIGLLAVGGGAATIPFLFDLQEKYAWFSASDLTNMIALSEASPGPIGVNMATFAGFKTAGILGALSATCGLVLPSLLIIITLSKIVDKVASYKSMHTFLKPIQPAVAALILNATCQIAVISLQNILSLCILGLILLCMRFYKASPIFYITLSGFLGFILKL